MASADGNLWITYNGEVYNYLELRASSRNLAARFARQPTPSVCCRHTRSGGRGARPPERHVRVRDLEPTRGVALLRTRPVRGKALRRRGRSRTVPLRFRDQVALCRPGAPARAERCARLRLSRLESYRPHAGDDMFAGIYQLAAGCHMRVDEHGVGEPTRWYAPRPASAASSVMDLRRLLESAVELRLRSDVPVGASLSGGMDSSSVLAVSASIEERRGGAPPASFSSRSSVPSADEFRYTEALLRTTASRNAQFLPLVSSSLTISTRSSGSWTSRSTARRRTRTASSSNSRETKGSSCCSTDPAATRRCPATTTTTTRRCCSRCCGVAGSATSCARYAPAVRCSASRFGVPRRTSPNLSSRTASARRGHRPGSGIRKPYRRGRRPVAGSPSTRVLRSSGRRYLSTTGSAIETR